MMGPHHDDVSAASPAASEESPQQISLSESDGIVPRLLVDVFAHVATLKGRSFSQVSVTVSYIELYNEHVLDLLDPARQESMPLADLLRRSATLNLNQDAYGIRVAGALSVPVVSPLEVMGLLARGNHARATAPTSCNAFSSRSHAICIVTIINSNTLTGRDLCSQVYLCDLAGSERLSKSNAVGSRLREAQHINKGLLALTNVINALVREQRNPPTYKDAFIPYRDSKLTRVLQNAFGGNGRTAIICNISPTADAYGESMSTLRFGSQCQRILNTVRSNLKLRSRAELDRLLAAAEGLLLAQRQQLRRAQAMQV